MTRRGIPPSYTARQRQSRRSTFIGTLDGRVANAYPLPLLATGRALPGLAATGTPAYRWVSADAGPAGTTVSTWPARQGPALILPDWAPDWPAVVDADGSITFPFTGATTSHWSVLVDATDAATNRGVARGYTLFVVAQLLTNPGAPAPAGDYNTRAVAVNMWLGEGESSDGATEGILEMEVSNQRHSTALGDSDDLVHGEAYVGSYSNVLSQTNFADWLTAAPTHGPITSGARQLFETGGLAGATPYFRIGGTDLPSNGGDTDPIIRPWRLRDPLVQAYGRDGYPVKLWEIVMFPQMLQGDRLTYWRTYFATTYGVSV